MRLHRPTLLFVLGIALLGCSGDFMRFGPRGEVAEAEERVNAVLAGMQEAGDSTSVTLQEAVCRWYNGKRFVSDAFEQEAAADGFDRWRRERNLYNRKIASYEIVSSELVPDAERTTVLVTVTIEGKTHRIEVPEKRKMSWHGSAPR